MPVNRICSSPTLLLPTSIRSKMGPMSISRRGSTSYTRRLLQLHLVVRVKAEICKQPCIRRNGACMLRVATTSWRKSRSNQKRLRPCLTQEQIWVCLLAATMWLLPCSQIIDLLFQLQILTTWLNSTKFKTKHPTPPTLTKLSMK